MQIKENINLILDEIREVLDKVDQGQVDVLVKGIRKANKIIVCGAGRVGYAIKGFGMRLGHLGFNTYALGDTTVPAISEGDLLLVATGSGETQTIFDLVTIAKKNRATIIAVTGNPDSRIGMLADHLVKITAPSKTKAVEGFISIQPMTTLNEQCLGIFFDGVVLQLMEEMNETHDTMWSRHSNLE